MKSGMNNSKTDWENYYQNPSFFSQFTRKSTENILLSQLRARQAITPIHSICELGGANSCFYPAIRKAFPDALYTVVDNHEAGLSIFKERYAEDAKLDTQWIDLISEKRLPAESDVVFSVGLIEHFSIKDTALVIEKHFACAKSGGLVMMTFPTPTWLYNSIRFLSERCGQWIFHDERALTLEEVCSEVISHAQISARFINWKTLLTQGVVISNKIY